MNLEDKLGKKGLVRVTKQEWDGLYKEGIEDYAYSLIDELKKNPLDVEMIEELSTGYIAFLEFREEYVKVKHDYHLLYYLNGNSLTYAKNGRIVKGFGFKPKGLSNGNK